MKARERKQLLEAAEAYLRSGRAGLARAALESLIEADATSSRAFELLGYVHGNEGRLQEAHRCLEQAARLPGVSPEALHYLGVARLQQGLAAQAVEAFDRSMARAGPFFEALHERGTAWSRLGKGALALESYQRALRLRPDSFELLFNLGKVHDQLLQPAQALAFYERALALNPASADVLAHRGAALHDLHRLPEAIDSWQQALSRDPRIEHLPGLLLHARLRVCDWQQWEAQRAGLMARFGRGEPVCGPFQMLAIDGDEQVQHRCAQDWERAQRPAGADGAGTGPVASPATSLTTRPATAAGTPAGAAAPSPRRIRIGWFSADFRRHAVAYLVAELLGLLDRQTFEVIGWSTRRADPGDETRAQLVATFDRFIEAADLSDAELVEQARGAGLDIAVDLGGHTLHSRTAVFRARVAPVQVNFLGYPGTMGGPGSDYLIADEVVIPGPSREHYTEKIVWLPECFQPSDTRRVPGPSSTSRADFGLPPEGFVFCCFNSTYKLNPAVFARWMQILRAVEGACLWLLAEDEAARDHLRAEATRAGIAPGRLVFGGRLPLAGYLDRFRHADLFLDTVPFCAGTTANDALLMGLPLLTQRGDAFAGRMAASLLTALALPELITQSAAEYEDRAVWLARHPEELRQLRARLQASRDRGPAFDMRRYARHLGQAFVELHQRHQRGEPAAHLRIAAAGPQAGQDA